MERILPWIFFAAFALLLGPDCLRWHPGFSFFDEGLGTVQNVQLWMEGGSLPFELFKGCLHRDLAAFFMRIFGANLEAWRAFTLLCLGLESLLLWRLGSRLFNPRAGLWALGFNLAAALTFCARAACCPTA